MVEWDLKLAIKMWNSGSSALIIARHFGITKNAVIGRIHRARYNGHYVLMKANPTKPKVLKPRQSKAVKPLLTLVTKDKPVKEGLAIYDLEFGQCKYSTSESSTGEYLFCGKPTPRTYCDEHHALCHKKEERKEQVSKRNYKNKYLRTY